MTLEEIEQSLSSGFHDAYVSAVHLNYTERKAELDMRILYAGPDDADPEEYRSFKLTISGLLYFVIEPPVNLCTSDPEPWLSADGPNEPARSASQLPKPLPDGAFTHWFFVNNWNSFIHIAALNAELSGPTT